MHETQSAKTDWITPRETVWSLGPFALDPCCAPVMPWCTAMCMYSNSEHLPTETQYAAYAWMVRCDGLADSWDVGDGAVWLNPPYGAGTVEPWLRRMAEHGRGIALLPTRVDTAWWHDLVLPHATAILWRRGRLAFCNPYGRPVSGNTVGSAFVAYGWAMVGRLAEAIRDPHVGNGGYLQICA
jgi:hypothetical protein